MLVDGNGDAALAEISCEESQILDCCRRHAVHQSRNLGLGRAAWNSDRRVFEHSGFFRLCQSRQRNRSIIPHRHGYIFLDIIRRHAVAIAVNQYMRIVSLLNKEFGDRRAHVDVLNAIERLNEVAARWKAISLQKFIELLRF